MATGSAPDEAGRLHRLLVDALHETETIQSPTVAAAFRAVPRHLFLPGVPLEQVYQDDPIPTKRSATGEVVSSSSQPSVMALMLDQLDLQPGQRVLEIGTGTGYNAALLAHIVGDHGAVVTLDVDEDIVDAASSHLASVGYGNVQVHLRDGWEGFEAGAPYDRIIVTASSWDISPAWRVQLIPQGRVVLPLRLASGTTVCAAFMLQDDYLSSVSLSRCGFVALRSDDAGQPMVQEVRLEAAPGLSLVSDTPLPVQPSVVHAWFAEGGRYQPTTVQLTLQEMWASLNLWIEVRETNVWGVKGTGEVVMPDLVPWLMRHKSEQTIASTWGLMAAKGLALFAPPPGTPPKQLPAGFAESFDLWICSFGPDQSIGQRLAQHVQAWNTAGRPTVDGMRIRAYQNTSSRVVSAPAIAIEREAHTLVLDWPAQEGTESNCTDVTPSN